MEMRKQLYRGEMYWVELGGAIGSEQGSRRICCIISNNTGNKFSPVVTIVPLTSQMHKGNLPTHVHITSGYGNIPKDSVILVEQARTIDKSRLGDRVGSLYGEKLKELNKAISITLGLIPVPLKGVDEEVIKDKVESVQELDSFISMWKSKGRLMKDIKDFIEEREIKLKDLVQCCDENNVRVERYYNTEEYQRKMVC